MVFYSVVILLVVRELTDAITGSLVGSLIDFGKTVVHFSPLRKISKNSSKINCRPQAANSNSKVESKHNWKGKSQGPHQTQKLWWQKGQIT